VTPAAGRRFCFAPIAAAKSADDSGPRVAPGVFMRATVTLSHKEFVKILLLVTDPQQLLRVSQIAQKSLRHAGN